MVAPGNEYKWSYMPRCWHIFGLLLALAIWPNASSGQTPSGDCTLFNPGACRTTNEIVWDPAFERALERFLGDRQAAYLHARGPVRDQAEAVLGGPPDTPVVFGNLYRFTACRAHSCDEKGAVIVTRGGRVLAVAMLHSACVTSPRPSRCAAKMRLAVHVHSDADQALVVGNLSQWAADAVERRYTPPGLVSATLEGVDVSTVDSDH